MNRLPMPLAYACARFANGCLLQLQSTVDRAASRPVEQLKRPARRHPASSHITVRSLSPGVEVAVPAKCLTQDPDVKAGLVSHPIDIDWLGERR